MSIPSPRDAYFQGLLSQRLGPDRLVDDELVLLIIEDRDFRSLCKTYSSKGATSDGLAARVALKAKLLAVDEEEGGRPHSWAVWSTILDDPRFDLVWKRALDELRDPLPVVRNSLFARILTFLAKFKKTGDGASVLPLLLGTFAATTAVWATPAAIDFAKNRLTPGDPGPQLVTTPPNLAVLNQRLEAIDGDLKGLTAAILACDTCKRAGTPVEAKSTDIAPLTQELEKLRRSSHKDVDAVAQAVRDNSISIYSLKGATDAIPPAVDRLRNLDASPIGQTLKNIETNTGITAEAVREYVPTVSADAKPYINKTLADSRDVVTKIRAEQANAADLQDTLKASRFTVDSLRKGAAFLLQLRPTATCVAFQVIQMTRDSVVLRYKTVVPCGPVTGATASAVFALNDRSTIRLNTTPRLVSNAGGTDAMGLYLSLERARGASILPPSRSRSFVGVYSKADWDLKL